jgi:hypothetical protein
VLEQQVARHARDAEIRELRDTMLARRRLAGEWLASAVVTRNRASQNTF